MRTAKAIMVIAALAASGRAEPAVQFSAAASSVSESSGAAAIRIELSAPAAARVTIGYSVTGGTAYAQGGGHLTADSGMVYGSGMDCSLPSRWTFGTVSFAAGETTRSLDVGIVDDNIVEADETLRITLANPSGATVGATATHTLTIVDNDRKALVNVRDFGAKGDGAADDTRAIQDAVNSVQSKGGAVVLFPEGTYMVTSVQLPVGVSYYGYGAVIKRPPNQGKWMRTFVCSHSGAADSKPLIVKGFTLDGGSETQGAYKNYELEQAHLLSFSGNSSSPGRLCAVVEDCMLRNGVADGIAVINNVDITAYRCTGADVFRGILTLQGGHNKVRIYDMASRVGPNGDGAGLHIEVDAGPGYGGDYANITTIDGLLVEAGGYNGGASAGSTTTVHNLQVPGPDFYNFSGGGTATSDYHNCSFAIDAADSYERILRPGALAFTNCSFAYTRQRTNGFWGIDVWWNHPSIAPNATGQTVTFNDCVFAPAASFPASSEIRAVYSQSDNTSMNNVLIIKGGMIAKGCDAGLYMSNGGTWVVKDAIIEAARPVVLRGGCDVTLDGAIVRSGEFIDIGSPGSTKLTLSNIQIEQSANVIVAGSGLGGITLSGHRVVYGSAAPTSATNGFAGDIYRLREGMSMRQWRCTAAGYLGSASAQWQAIEDAPLPVVTVGVQKGTASESPLDSGRIVVTRTGSTEEALTVCYGIGGSAVNGRDYRFVCPAITIPAGQASRWIDIVPVDDTAQEPDEMVTLTLEQGSGYSVGGAASGSVTIRNHYLGPEPSSATTAAPAAGGRLPEEGMAGLGVRAGPGLLWVCAPAAGMIEVAAFDARGRRQGTGPMRAPVHAGENVVAYDRTEPSSGGLYAIEVRYQPRAGQGARALRSLHVSVR